MRITSFPLLLSLPFLFVGCRTQEPVNTQEDSLAQVDVTVSPVVLPAESIGKMRLEKGFEATLVAAEPLVTAPVALTFDARGRMWVVEMIGYMPDTLGTGEDIPNGKVVILEDTDADGVADRRQVFLDSLVLPRAICLVDNGILVAEPPNLWYYEIRQDRPGTKVLVDGAYARGGNVEHQPNGLVRAMDNWIYSAKSSKRYRKSGDKWLQEPTHFRGQWGISQDNLGRMYYNDNSTNLLGDYFAPGLGKNNPNQRQVAGYSEIVVPDNRVYPARPTTGVNRGYSEGILDSTSQRLVNFTAACGPVIYRGGLFGEAYAGNAFVAEPAGNLIKRNILYGSGNVVTGEQAYQGKEFLASVDERFRPVNLYNGPDGALYLVDMYRGIIQHRTYLTPYLKNEIRQRELTQPLACGRIYRIGPKNQKGQPVRLPQDPAQLVQLLGHANGWVRDQAQQLLVDTKPAQAVPALRLAVRQRENPLLAMHALWTLEGLGALQAEEVLPLLQNLVWPLRMQALSVLPSIKGQPGFARLLPVLGQLVEQHDTLAAPYIGFLANHFRSVDQGAREKLLEQLARQYPDNRLVASAIISNLQGREEAFLQRLTTPEGSAPTALQQQLRQVVAYRKELEANRNPQVLRQQFPAGAALFASSCQTCHGPEGNGVRSLAPPLNKSEWVTGDKNKLAAIVLYGLTGPVQVAGHLYQAPEINGDMPGIGYDPSISDEQVAQLLSFIRKSWQNNADRVSAEEVAKVRREHQGRKKAFTVKDLDK